MLKACHLQSPHCLNCILSYLSEKVCVLPNRGLDRSKVPIFLGIQGGSCCLACVKTREGPLLQLEVRHSSSFWGTLQCLSCHWDVVTSLYPHVPFFVPHLCGQLRERKRLLPLGIYRKNITVKNSSLLSLSLAKPPEALRADIPTRTPMSSHSCLPFPTGCEHRGPLQGR